MKDMEAKGRRGRGGKEEIRKASSKGNEQKGVLQQAPVALGMTSKDPCLSPGGCREAARWNLVKTSRTQPGVKEGYSIYKGPKGTLVHLALRGPSLGTGKK